MRLKILSQPYKVKCPACGHELLIIARDGKIRGQERCPACDTQFEWDRSDEVEKEMRSR